MFSLLVILCHILFSSLVPPILSLPLEEITSTAENSIPQSALINELISHAQADYDGNRFEKLELNPIKNGDSATETRQFAPVLIVNGPLRIWAIGSVSKFPPFFEHFVQRIQSYFSIYKYQDLSRPVEEAEEEIEKVSEQNAEIHEEDVNNEAHDDENSNANEEVIESEIKTDNNSSVDEPNIIEQ